MKRDKTPAAQFVFGPFSKPPAAKAPPPKQPAAPKGRRAAIEKKPQAPSPPAGKAKRPASARAKGKARPAPKPAWPQPLEPGVYFGLPAALHHDDPGLGSGDVGRLLIGAPEYWHDSALNPDRPRYEPTKPQEFGSAMHNLVLEGVEAFRKSYEAAPDPDGLLVTAEDIDRALADLGDGDPPRRKGDKITRLIELDPSARIKDVIVGAAEAAGRTVLARDEYQRIVQGALLLSQDDEYRDAFVGGEAEVTVIYLRPDGIRCKSRFDYLKPRAIVDLKTIGNTRGIPFKRAVLSSFWNYRRDLQAEHYCEGRRQLPELVRKGRVFGKVDRDWLRTVAEQPSFAFVFVYFSSIGAPIHYGFKLSPGNPILEYARENLEASFTNYKKFMAEYGPDRMWLMREPLAELAIEEFPNFAFR